MFGRGAARARAHLALDYNQKLMNELICRHIKVEVQTDGRTRRKVFSGPQTEWGRLLNWPLCNLAGRSLSEVVGAAGSSPVGLRARL